MKVKVPGGRVALHYRPKKPQKAHCGSCGSVLHGIPHHLSFRVKKLSKTERRPERAYGGVFCSKCSRKKIMERSL